VLRVGSTLGVRTARRILFTFGFTLQWTANVRAIFFALFEVPGRYIAQPRVLARTTNIDQGIVTLEEGRVVIGPPSTASPGLKAVTTGGRRTTITQEQYFEGLEVEFLGISQRLNAFVDDLAAYNVAAEFGSQSTILRWRPDNGRLESWYDLKTQSAMARAHGW
jgi:hypothetical protein